MSRDPAGRRAARFYALLLHCYPRDFRRRFGRDIGDLFTDRWRTEAARAGVVASIRFWCRILLDLLESASRERLAALGDWWAARLIPREPPGPGTPRSDSMLETLLHDLRFALRMLRKSPTFVVVAILVIALGSGAVTTIFSGASALLLRPIPGIDRPGQLVEISRTTPEGRGGAGSVSYPFYARVRDQTRALSGVAAWSSAEFTVSRGDQGSVAHAVIASANYFTVLGVRPLLGRLFVPAEADRSGGAPVVVLSEGFWRRRFGADSSLLGRPVEINAQPFTVVGVAPAAFRGVMPMQQVDAWVPVAAASSLGVGADILANPRAVWLRLFGRLDAGASLAQARSDVARLVAQYAHDAPGEIDPATRGAVEPLTSVPSEGRGMIAGFLALLLAIAALVLVIASVNVAGMLLARATTRRREMAVRIALGAGRARLVRQLLTESLVLFVGGAAGGLLIAIWSSRLFAKIPLPANAAIDLDVAADLRVLAFALGAALVTGIVFGLAPALEATRSDPSAGLRSDSSGAGTRRRGLRDALVVGQMAIALLLLMSAGLFLRALARGQQIPTGFATDHVVTASFDVSRSGYDKARATRFYDALAARLEATPGVTAVSYTRVLPLNYSTYSTRVRIAGYTPPQGSSPDGMVDLDFNDVGPEYFTLLRIPLVRGREFLPTDDAAAAHVAVVNESFARSYWPGLDPIGQQFTDGRDSTTITVVGVARDAKYSSLTDATEPFAYRPVAQDDAGTVNLLVRTGGAMATLPAVIRDATRELDPLVPPPQVITMDQATSVALLPQRLAALVTGAMGVLGLLLALVGLYGVVAYTVSQRTREIGVRMALGADRATVLRMIVRDGMRLVLIGVGVGMVLALAATRVMSRFLFGVSPLDPLVFAVIPLALGAATLLASYLPARRAAATDPLVALREE